MLDSLRHRLICNVEIVPFSGCWIWVKSVDRDGYGKSSYKGKRWSAHRLSFYAFIREPQKDEMVLHHCDIACCINPYHLYAGDAKDNRKDALDRRRWKHPFGDRDACAAGHKYLNGSYKIAKRDGSRICKECLKLRKRKYRSNQPLVKR